MDEAFLHFVWKFQRFTPQPLASTDGEPINVFFPGHHNHDSGPDFSEARIKIGDMEWNGQVEIHLKSSDWNHHQHTGNPAYENVILHVVWQHDVTIKRSDESTIPTLELKKLVDPALVDDYRKFLNQPEQILCASHLHKINALTWISNLDAMLTHRLEEKSARILELAKEKQFDWEEVAYVTLARNFGFSLNAESFEQLARSLPLKTIAKNSLSKQVEALIFGQAGFLEEPLDGYQKELKSEFDFLVKKHNLSTNLHRAHWKFGKMRPSNFPSVRLAQFSSLLFKTVKLFSLFSTVDSVCELKKDLTLELPAYWQNHYDFNKPLKRGTNQLGRATLENLIINSVVPILAAYSIHTDHQAMMNKAIQFLEDLSPESNRYTKPFEAIGKSPKHAFDSQALITLHRDFCSRKKCVNCTIGTAILSR